MLPGEIAAELDAIADLIESVWEHGTNRQSALEEVEGRVIGLARRIRGRWLRVLGPLDGN